MTAPSFKIFVQQVSPPRWRAKILNQSYAVIPAAGKFTVKLARNLFTIALVADPFLWFNISTGYQQVISYIHLFRNVPSAMEAENHHN